MAKPTNAKTRRRTIDGAPRPAVDHARRAGERWQHYPELPVRYLGMAIRMDPDATFDPETQALWVRRRNPLERGFAWLIHRGETRLRIDVDRVSAWVLGHVPPNVSKAVTTIATEMGVPLPTDEEAFAAALEGRFKEPPHEGLVSLLVFVHQMVEGGAFRAEPI